MRRSEFDGYNKKETSSVRLRASGLRRGQLRCFGNFGSRAVAGLTDRTRAR